MPGARHDRADLPVRHGGKPLQHVPEVGIRVYSAAAAGLDHRIDDSTSFAGTGIPEEKPVLLAYGTRTDGVLDEIMPTARLCRVEVGTWAFPGKTERPVMARAA